MRRLSVVVAGLAAGAACVAAEDWPQWRGPAGNAVSAEQELPAEWGPQKSLAWKAKLAGFGASSPIVWGDTVVVTSQIGSASVAGGSHPLLARDDRSLAGRESAMSGARMPATEGAKGVLLVVEAFDRSSGRRLWEHRTPATGEFPELHEKHNLATPTPATDGERIIAWFGNGQVVALNMQGKLLWARHLGAEVAPFHNPWGHGSSPVLCRDLVILLCDHRPASYLLALDKRSGAQRYKVDRGSGRTAHSTPLIYPAPAGEEMLINSSERIDVYDPASGKLLWHAGSERQTPIPTAVFHEGLVYLSRGYRNSDYLALKPGGRGAVDASHVLWRAPGGASYVPSILQYLGLLYLTNEVGVVTCADAATGQTVWRHRLGGVFFASPVAGDGKVYLVSETGVTFVLRAGRRADVLAENDLGERFIASPAIAGGRLFLRSDGTLFAIGR
jgi:outer membrane protein assembly factor BamB